MHHFVANVQLLSTAEGGRKGPLFSGEWRTVLGINHEHWSARLAFSGEPAPGQSFVAQVQLLRPDVALPFFRIGAQFTVWEGDIKGVGQVVALAAT